MREHTCDYHKGQPRIVERPNGVQCTNPICTSGDGDYCNWCGFNTKEASRRKHIPLTEYIHAVKDDDGNIVATQTLRCKFVGTAAMRLEAAAED